MNKSGIEWCDHTWNPITGCRHGCSYCYADKMSLRFCGNVKRNMVQTDQYRMEGDLFVLDKPFMNEDGKPVIYPFGFEPTLHIYRYDILDKLKQGQNIFVGAMADIFGEWIPDSWIGEIYLDMCLKIVNAPTQIHRMVTPKMMLPLIDDKLQEEFKETEARE